MEGCTYAADRLEETMNVNFLQTLYHGGSDDTNKHGTAQAGLTEKP